MYRRYGFYVVPEGALFDAGSAWLGWNSATGMTVTQPDLPDLPVSAEMLTATPRKYGFHGTIKPPFVLSDGAQADDLNACARAFCAASAPVTLSALEVRRLGGFIAMVPSAPSSELATLAGAAVAALDDFRAPPTPDELARRRKIGLSNQQEEMLQRWGYPFVRDCFRFHMTLTGRTPKANAVCTALGRHFAPLLSKPFTIASLALMGEAADGAFHVIDRYPLGA